MAIDPSPVPPPSRPRFTADLTRPRPEAGGGVEAWGAIDQSDPSAALMALRVARNAPIRADMLDLLREPIEQLLIPLGHGHGFSADGQPAYYLYCQTPPGPPLSADPRPWPETALLSLVLRPVAQVLIELERRGATHRGIRADNVFRGPPGTPVVLGASWSEPAAFRQPALFEPPYSASCHRSGRGNGTIADDVYALGVLLIVLALGRLPLQRLDETAIIGRKHSLGSFAAIANDEKLPQVIADLARNMLAEDPDHRPPPSLLLDALAARGRRVAARPPHRATRPLRLGQSQAWDARGLAFAIGREPDAAIQGMRSGETTQWLRRSLGDSALAARLEEFQRHRVIEGPILEGKLDAWLLMRVVAQIDPLAPLNWRGVSFWPDALGALMAAGPSTRSIAAEVVDIEVVAQWTQMREDRADSSWSRTDGLRHRAIMQLRGPSGGVPRLLYTLNPVLPCEGKLLEGRWVMSLADLPPALDSVITRVETGANPLDEHVLAFIAVRAERRLDPEVNALNGRLAEGEHMTAVLRLLAALQVRSWPYPLPSIAAWIAARGGPLVSLWHNRAKRESLAAALNDLAKQGFLTPMWSLVNDAAAHDLDLQGSVRARQELVGINLELAALGGGAAARARHADRVGQEIVAGIGLAALAAMLVLAALG